MAGTWNRRNRNRPGPIHGTAGICTPGTRVPGYPSIVIYRGPKTRVYVDSHSSDCASRPSPLAPADYRSRVENTPINTCLAYHASAPIFTRGANSVWYPGTRVHLTTPPLKREKETKQCMVTRVLGYPGTQIPVSASFAAAQTLKKEQIVYSNPGTRVPGYPVPVYSGTRVPGSGSASTAPHPVGYPVLNFEAGVQL